MGRPLTVNMLSLPHENGVGHDCDGTHSRFRSRVSVESPPPARRLQPRLCVCSRLGPCGNVSPTPSLPCPHGRTDREPCGHHTTCPTSSPSSADAHLRFPDGTSLLQTPRWDEPQRACALEQICGVFRVDLGQMRSLRLFFR